MTTNYIVKKGDNLWSIAKKHLGDGSRYPDIMTASGITSEIINVGQVLKIPVKTDYTAIGQALETCINDIERLPSFIRLVSLLK